MAIRQVDGQYREVVPFTLMTLIAIVELGLAALFLFLFFYQRTAGPLGSDPAPDWVFIVLALLFFGLGILFVQARRLTISATAEALTISVGPFKHSVRWERIQGYHADKGSGIKYGGWGIRMARVSGQWALVYSVPGYTRVMLHLNSGRFRLFGFSTNHPDEVMNMLQQQTGMETNQ